MALMKRCLLLLLLICIQDVGLAEVLSPLKPADTSSPRATLEGYLQNMRDRYAFTMGKDGLLQRYMSSGNLYMDEDDFGNQIRIMYLERDLGSKYLDLRDVPLANQGQIAWRLCLQLKEIIDRVGLPPMGEVPDRTAMEGRQSKRWRLPGTDLFIAQMEEGPQEGEYLFSRDSVSRIPDDYELVRHLPYVETDTLGLYDLVFVQPSGLAVALRRIVPPRWLMQLPQGWRVQFLEQPLWRWLALVVMLAGSLAVFQLSRHLCQAYLRRNPGHVLVNTLPSILLLLMVPWMLDIMSEVLKVSPRLFSWMMKGLWGVFYMALTWLLWLLGGMGAEFLIRINGIRNTNVDGQLIRLLVRLVSLVFTTCILMDGANRIGLPAYSVLAGLGIGGLAVALAGQQALANLLGSLIIMLEQPFRIGHSIKTSGMEGKVEDIGFRSAVLRTPENTLLIVPSAELINHTIENLTLRKSWRIRRILILRSSCKTASVMAFRSAIESTLRQHEDIKHESVCVGMIQISLGGFELLIDFALRARDEHDQIRKTDKILCQVAVLAEQCEITFSRNSEPVLMVKSGSQLHNNQDC